MPLTEDQKKEKLDELRAKLAAKRAAQAKQDIEANKANEVGVPLVVLGSISKTLDCRRSVVRLAKTQTRSRKT